MLRFIRGSSVQPLLQIFGEMLILGSWRSLLEIGSLALRLATFWATRG